MNSKHHRLIYTLVLLTAMVLWQSANAARPVRVTAADPAEAEQGTTLEVTISGSGFDTAAGAVHEVNFLPVSYTHLTLPTNTNACRYRWSRDH